MWPHGPETAFLEMKQCVDALSSDRLWRNTAGIRSFEPWVPPLSRESATCHRSPAISSAAFGTRPPDLPPAPLMDTDFIVSCRLVRRRRPHIRFLYIGPYLWSR